MYCTVIPLNFNSKSVVVLLIYTYLVNIPHVELLILSSSQNGYKLFFYVLLCFYGPSCLKKHDVMLCYVMLLCDAPVCHVARFVGQTIGNRYGAGTGKIWLDELQCTGSQTFIDDCHHNDWGSHDCAHYEDVSVACTLSLIHISEPTRPY